jgi:flagellar hook-basal body complex protein FliE
MEISRISPSLTTSARGAYSPKPAGVTSSFQSSLANAIQDLNSAQLQADNAIVSLASGQNVDVHDVTMAVEEASIGMQLGVQVRNKLVEAYQEIMRMQI